MSELTTESVPVNGVRSPILQAGSRDRGEAVVFVHGNPGPAADWRGLLSQTGEFARAVAPDMPGYGGADKPRGFRYTVDGYADHLGGLLDALDISRAHLVLHDFGGPWGLAWAARHPEAFASATLINTGVLPDYKWHRYARIWRTPVVGELFQLTATRGAFRLLVGRENPRLQPDAIDHLYEAARGWPTKRAVLKLYRATPAKSARGPIEELAALNRPALVLWGTDDAYLPWQFADRQQMAFPSARIELLEGLGHWPFHEDPARIAELVIPFLRAQVTAPVA
ncbi:MAG: alpha/beta fold hydrolase [Thermoleophilaceae bacterium]